MANKYKVKVKGTFEYEFIFDEGETKLGKSLDSELMDTVAFAYLPMGCKPRKKIAKIDSFEKELLKEDEGEDDE